MGGRVGRRGAACAALCISVAASAQAPAPGQVQPPTREELLRPPPAPERRAGRLTVEGGVERAPCALDTEANRDIRFTLRSVQFDDLRGLSPEALRPAYDEFVGTAQPVATICEIRDRAATILRNAGYVAAVEVPEQRIADGAVRFQVLMAKLVAVRVRGDAGRAEQAIAAYLERLTDQEVFNRFVAERYLLLAGDLPGYDVRLSLRSANAGRGEVIGEVAVLRTPFELDFNVQNYGSTALGRFGGLLRGQFYGLTGLGDRTTLALFSTFDFDEQQTVQFGHDFRVGGEGLTFSGLFTHAWAEPDVGDPSQRVKSRTVIASAEASYPFLRSQAETARGALGLDVINQRVRVNGIPLSRDRLRVAYLRLDLDSIDPGSLAGQGGFSSIEPRWRIGGSIQARQGLDVLDASAGCGPRFVRCPAGVVPPGRLEGDPTASLFRVDLAGEVRPAPRFAVFVGGRFQKSGDPLLSFEEFSGGNYTSGRGYDPGTIVGDSGIGLQVEARLGSILPASADAVSAQPYVFFDAARVYNNDRLTPDAFSSLASVGGGVRGIWRGASFDVAVAVPLKRAGLPDVGETRPRRGGVRVLASLTTRLLPWSFK